VRCGVITPVAGRHGHLRLQRKSLARGSDVPEAHVVVSMGDPDVPAQLHGEPPAVLVDAGGTGPLPLARARNEGAARALALGAELLLFLDVDCLAGVDMVARYRAAAERAPDAVLCGPVSYLPAPRTPGYDLDEVARLAGPHPARPAPPDGELARNDDYHLFWSLSFAVTASTWTRIGGFCERYAGYGAEDTDFGELARAAGRPLCWVGGAAAYHQYHPVSDPPVEHAADIVRNADVFRDRWGYWPMSGWLSALRDRRVVRYDAAADRWHLTSSAVGSP
jgi:GT2 family glycosyltransferase